MPVDHYENFPVASVLLPKRLRKPVEIIYWFARSADDIADEGEIPDEMRLSQLAFYDEELQRIASGTPPQSELFIALAPVIQQFALPIELFHDLISAFRQDVTKKRYDDFGELMQYCRRSANPVGRLMLHLFGMATPKNLALSDGICSALQLINFWQDIAIDWQKGRIYLPAEDLARFGLNETHIAKQVSDFNWQALMKFQIERTKRLLEAGSPLGLLLPGRLGIEIRMIVLGGERVLKKLWASQGDVFHRRPVLGWKDWLYISFFGVFPRLLHLGKK